MMNPMTRLIRLEQAAAEARSLEEADPDHARQCLLDAKHHLAYVGGSWATRDDGLRYIEPWDAKTPFPIERQASAAAICSFQLAEAIGDKTIARLGWHPAYCAAHGVPVASNRERAILDSACRAKDPSIRLLARLTAAFLDGVTS